MLRGHLCKFVIELAYMNAIDAGVDQIGHFLAQTAQSYRRLIWRKNSRGWGSKVSTHAGSASRWAASLNRWSIAWWPRWTPSKLPIVNAIGVAGWVRNDALRQVCMSRNPKIADSSVFAVNWSTRYEMVGIDFQSLFERWIVLSDSSWFNASRRSYNSAWKHCFKNQMMVLGLELIYYFFRLFLETFIPILSI